MATFDPTAAGGASEEMPEGAAATAARPARLKVAPARAYELRPTADAGWYVLVACDVAAVGEV